MNEALSLPAALLMGLAASAHCVAMCGGISGALGLAAAPRSGVVVMTPSRPAPAPPRSKLPLLLVAQIGRISSYALAGAVVGGLSTGAMHWGAGWIGLESVSLILRVLTGLAICFAAAVVLGWVRDPAAGLGARVWQRVAPWARHLLPLSNLRRALAFGAIWGWMPCGFVYSVLWVAAFAGDATQAAALMLAFGLGTVPAMVATAAGAPWLRAVLARRRYSRQVLATLLVVCAVFTAAPALWSLVGNGHGAHDHLEPGHDPSPAATHAAPAGTPQVEAAPPRRSTHRH